MIKKFIFTSIDSESYEILKSIKEIANDISQIVENQEEDDYLIYEDLSKYENNHKHLCKENLL